MRNVGNLHVKWKKIKSIHTLSQLVLKEFYVGFALLSTFHRCRRADTFIREHTHERMNVECMTATTE